VAAAVEIARSRAITLGEGVLKGVKTLASDAGPPEKILKYLEELARLAEARRETKLGTTLI
jgi:hypothetical protein